MEPEVEAGGKEVKAKVEAPMEGKPSAFKNSAGAAAALVEKYRSVGLKRLTPEQAAFFHLHSADENMILSVDRNRKIANPVGYLLKEVLGINLKDSPHRDLLFERVEEREEAPFIQNDYL